MKIYNHLIVLSKDNVNDLLAGKDTEVNGFMTCVDKAFKKIVYSDIEEVICTYKIHFSIYKEKITYNDELIEIFLDNTNDEFYDYLLNMANEKETEPNYYNFKIKSEKENHHISITVMEVFEQSKLLS